MNPRIIKFIFGATIGSTIALLLFVLQIPVPAQAATPYVVTNCTAQGLADAMNFMNNNNITDGVISFNCDNVHAAATISITNPGGYIVTSGAAYIIDGGSVITLTGLDSNRLLVVQKNGALTLTNISLIDGNAGADYGGCIFNFSGALRLDNVTLQNCRTADSYQGGAIYNNGGTLTLIGSRILSSTASYGGGIFSAGTLVIDSSTIAHNKATTGAGGGVHVTGNATISNSQITDNRANGGDGGGLYAESGSTVTIDHTLLDSNTTTTTQFASGGGLYSLGTVTIRDSTFTGNLARYGGGMDSEGTALLNNVTFNGNNRGTTTGGGIFNAGSTTLSNSTLSGNSADLGGGGIDNNGTLTVTNSMLSGNKAYTSGGGIFNERITTMSNSTLSGNSADGDGGGLYNYNSSTLNLSNSTLSGNSATQGGGIYNSNNANANLSNATLSANSATNGGGIFNAGDSTLINVTLENSVGLNGTAHNLYLYSGVLRLTNTIVNFKASSGANCFGAGSPKSAEPGGHNLANDTSCGLTATGDQQGPTFNPQLGPLQDNGGPTQTQLPGAGSPAIDKGTGTNAPATDQRGVQRPQGAGFDIGAVEVARSDLPTLANISGRLPVGTGDNALFAGFIVTGSQPKKVIIRGIGPSLGVAGSLADPTLELHNSTGGLIDANDNWQDSPNKQAIIDSGVAPTNDLESAIVATLPASPSGTSYTAIVRGAGNATGIGVVDLYDLDRSVDSKLANISNRGFVQTGDNVLFAGMIVLGQAPQKVIIRALGPSVPVSGAMADPTLELHDANGDILESNDNWVDSLNKQAIIDSTIPPTNDLESAIVRTLSPANYTAIVRGVDNTTGIAVVEVYALN